MVQLALLNGQQAGQIAVVRRFPFRLGRQAADLPLAEDGVWDAHAELRLAPDRSVRLHTRPEAPAWVNNEAAHETALRNGDLIQLGSARLQFSLAPTRQRTQQVREALTWIGLALLSLSQIAIVYALVD